MRLLLADEWLRIPSPATPQFPPLSLLQILEVHGRGLRAEGAFPPLPRPQLPRFSLVSLWKLLFSEAALGASGLTSPILRHSKRVFWGSRRKQNITWRLPHEDTLGVFLSSLSARKNQVFSDYMICLCLLDIQNHSTLKIKTT